jgi:hypothetical protein
MSRETSIFSFGERHQGNWDAVLPFRWLSSDGLCAIDLGHRKGVLGDWIKPVELRPIVRVLLDVCVRGSPNEGGLANNVGEKGDLLLRVVKYRPTVTCVATVPGLWWETCRNVVDSMSIDGRKVVFGPRGDPDTVVALPWKATTQETKCGVGIEGAAGGDVKDTADWYGLWMAANAVDYMCIQKGRQGFAFDLGECASILRIVEGCDSKRVFGGLTDLCAYRATEEAYSSARGLSADGGGSGCLTCQ